MITTKNIEEAKRLLKTMPGPKLVCSQSEAFDRTILEQASFDALVLQIHKKTHDRPKQLDAGINHVTAAIAAKKKISFAIDLDDLRSLDTPHLARTLARLSFLLPTLRKEGVSLRLINARDSRNARALLQSLGASSQQASSIS